MVSKSKGFKIKTRKKLKQKPRYRPTVNKFLQKFEIGEKVVIKQEPSSHKGMPHPRYKGMVGEVIGKRGRAYIISVEIGGKTKKIISRPEHMRHLKL